MDAGNAALTPPTPENVAAMLTDDDGIYHDGNDWHTSITASGNVVSIGITPFGVASETDLPEVHFRAVIVATPQAIDPEVAAHVLFHLGYGGYPGSQFVLHLLRAFEMADPVNRAQLGIGFPQYLAAFELYRGSDTGVAELQEIAKRYTP